MRSAHPALYLVPAAMLVAAPLHLPYGYYQLLRLVVCACAAYLAWATARGRLNAAALLLGGSALLFNPVFRVHFDRSTWSVINVAAALVFGALYAGSRQTARST